MLTCRVSHAALFQSPHGRVALSVCAWPVDQAGTETTKRLQRTDSSGRPPAVVRLSPSPLPIPPRDHSTGRVPPALQSMQSPEGSRASATRLR